MNNQKDIVSKDLLKRIAVDIARVLLNLRVDRAEIIETEFQRIEDRRADLIAQMWGEEGEFILHIEIQNSNDTMMPWRMLRYRSEIGHTYPLIDVRQYLIYIGKPALTMTGVIHQTGLNFHYRIIDMHCIDCQTLLAQDDPDALVLAILCDFKGKEPREVVHYILDRLKCLTAGNEIRFREYLRMLEILSTNRDLEKTIEEEEKMLSEVDYNKLPSYRIGIQKGIEKGIEKGVEQGIEQGLKQGIEQGLQQGEYSLLKRQLIRRFGPLPDWADESLLNATQAQLESWGEQIFDAKSLEDLLR